MILLGFFDTDGAASNPVTKGHQLLVAQEPRKLGRRAAQIHIRLKTAPNAHWQPGVFRIDLAGMYVENDRPPAVIHRSGHTPDQKVRKKSEVAAAEETYPLIQDRRHGDGKLQQRSTRSNDLVGLQSGIRNPAMPTIRRKHR